MLNIKGKDSFVFALCDVTTQWVEPLLQVLLQVPYAVGVPILPLGVEVFEAFYVWKLVLGPAVVPRREISVEEKSSASLSLLEQLEHKFYLVQ